MPPKPAPPADLSTLLTGLVRLVAAEDRAAFVDLYHRASGPLLAAVRSRRPAPPDAIAVVAAIFLEVWWLARFHAEAGVDAMAWIDRIADLELAARLRRHPQR